VAIVDLMAPDDVGGEIAAEACFFGGGGGGDRGHGMACPGELGESSLEDSDGDGDDDDPSRGDVDWVLVTEWLESSLGTGIRRMDLADLGEEGIKRDEGDVDVGELSKC
jgi:hypothetical protein